MAQKKANIPFKGLKPIGVSDAAWTAVIEAWTNGLSDREAAFRASCGGEEHVKESDIKLWMKEDPDIADLKEHLVDSLISSSKLLIAEAIKSGDTKTAKWYLERKAANEFSSKASVNFENAVVELTLDDKEKALKQMWEKFEHE